MAETQIEWTDATWNPVAGCSIVSAGCTNCYAMEMARRLQAMNINKYRGLTRRSGKRTIWNGVLREDATALNIPLRWKKPKKIFVNPPFSDKRWSNGIDPLNDPHHRFQSFGTPPAKQGDYAYLLHIVRSLKSTGRGACILPHGVLFRGGAEADIRRNLIRKGYIKGIIGLPANLFYGTGIPACIVVVDKKDANTRKGIFMIDASSGFMKDGPKNRLRDQDIHRIVDVFTKRLDVPKYARMRLDSAYNGLQP